MRFPILTDTIVAVSTAWAPSPLAIVRLSGPRAVELSQAILSHHERGSVAGCSDVPYADEGSGTQRLPATPVRAGRAHWRRAMLAVEAPIPGDVFSFYAPRSYTGQDVVEIHTVGCLPLVRAIADRLAELGARRALPGEFTARAVVAGKIDRDQVERILGLIHAEDARRAALVRRGSRSEAAAGRERVAEALRELLARVEAGIDFVDEEDVRFISEGEMRSEIRSALDALGRIAVRDVASLERGRPHVALAGLPNAGKSTLFNALVGSQRAVVSPVVGTTRDVISAELTVEGVEIMLQDTAGLRESSDELELAAHIAAEQAADSAELVLWAHDAGLPWEAREIAALGRIRSAAIIVLTKSDRAGRRIAPVPLEKNRVLCVSAATGDGLDTLRREIAVEVAAQRVDAGGAVNSVDPGVVAALERAAGYREPELIAWELRTAIDLLGGASGASVIDDILGRIFSRFCVGK